MKINGVIQGFSKLNKKDKLSVLGGFYHNPDVLIKELSSYWHNDPEKQRLFDEFSENTVSNYYFPYGIAPNFKINGKDFLVPMVIEESSVVAAASSAAKFWTGKGGFHAEVISTVKVGQVHFIWEGDFTKLEKHMPVLRKLLIKETAHITKNMRQRGGGILDIELVNKSDEIDNYYQLLAKFETIDSMGANFINSCLEEFGLILKKFLADIDEFTGSEKDCEIIMAILSNYTPECLVRSYVEAPVKHFAEIDKNISPERFTWKFQKAVEIAVKDIHRATTHNKGIFNGIDAVVLATGNDFRAIEAAGHTFASRKGKYQSLTHVDISNDIFRYELEIPMALGTVGGLTKLHPLARISLELLRNPSAHELMMIVASVGLANNFGALKSLVTKGIQVGHMKMHLFNILNYFQANPMEKEQAIIFFKDKKVSFNIVGDFIRELRAGNLANVKA